MNNDIPAILAVDDNPANLSLLFDVLDEANFEVLISQSGESALKRAESANPDIILLDVMMPGIDGFETCRHLKSNEATKAIPVIFMTALTETVDKVKGLELGAVDYITKPIQPEEVLARIKTHIMIQHLQQDLQRKNDALFESLQREKELNELKSRFISMASHEFRTPLATIQTSSDLLKRYGERVPPEKRLTHLKRIDGAIKRMTEMLDDVLTLSKTEAGKKECKPKPVDVLESCRHIVDEFRLINEKTHSITFTAPVQEFQALVDPSLLRHILSNLLSNAIKYSPTGCHVSFELSKTKNNLIFRITDTGIGISEADQKHLFEAFHRGQNVTTIKGTGLGLSIVKQFVELHRGSIEVKSQIDQGTTFTVRLPFIVPHQEEGRDREQVSGHSPSLIE